MISSMLNNAEKRVEEVLGIQISLKSTGDYSYYISVKEKYFGFSISRFPANCNFLIFSRIGGANEVLFKIVDILVEDSGHTGIFLSQSAVPSTWKKYDSIYRNFGYKPILLDWGIQHGGNKETRVYYKPLNEKRKKERIEKFKNKYSGYEDLEWTGPIGFIDKEESLT